MSEITTPTLEQNFETAMSAFEGILKKGDSNRGSLWLAWHYLQFYSVWGLRLPHTEEMLGKALGVDEPGRYTFFPTMQHSYTQVFETSQFFYNQVFDKIVALGGQLKDFAEKQSDGDRNMFAVILDHIHSGDINSAMEFLHDMVTESEEHTERATASHSGGSDTGARASAHHAIVTRFPNHMWESSWAIVSAERWSSAGLA